MNNKLLITIFAAVGALVIITAVVFIVSDLEEKEKKDASSTMATSTLQVKTIGSSVEGRDITAYTFGSGDTHLLFVGGIHGGYEWNSVLLAYTFIDHLKEHPSFIPDNIQISVIPAANPDGLYEVVGTAGRFDREDVSEEGQERGRLNANDVDLNRNFACKWQPTSRWRGQTVDAGTEAFSEPEARAIRDFVTAHEPEAVIFWHSQSDAVYASQCENGILSETKTVMNTYADAAGYPAVASFDAYEITGDAEGWLASIGIPAVTVELSSHEAIEWQKNKQGIEALLKYYTQE